MEDSPKVMYYQASDPGLFASTTDIFIVLEKPVSSRGLSIFHVSRYISLVGLTIS